MLLAGFAQLWTVWLPARACGFVFVQKVENQRAVAMALARDRRFALIYNDAHALVFEGMT